MSELKALSRKIMRALLADITDRRGWRQDWDMFDEDVKREIRKTHAAIIEKHLAPALRAIQESRSHD
jgi:hypothetical protein